MSSGHITGSLTACTGARLPHAVRMAGRRGRGPLMLCLGAGQRQNSASEAPFQRRQTSTHSGCAHACVAMDVAQAMHHRLRCLGPPRKQYGSALLACSAQTVQAMRHRSPPRGMPCAQVCLWECVTGETPTVYALARRLQCVAPCMSRFADQALPVCSLPCAASLLLCCSASSGAPFVALSITRDTLAQHLLQ